MSAPLGSVQRISPEQGAEILAAAGYKLSAPLAPLAPVAAAASSSVAVSIPLERIEYLNLDEIKERGLPPIPWLVPGWLMRGDIALLAGAGGIGKSTTAGSLAVALARGAEWCGIPPTRPMRVLYIDEEQGEAELSRLLLRLGAPHPNLRAAAMQGVRLDTRGGLERLENAVADFRPDVLIGDSAQQIFGATDENDATEVGLRYRELYRLRDTYQLTTLVLHHKRKDQGFRVDALELVRGSTAHGTQCSTVWFASPGGADRLNVVQAKRRGAKRLSLIAVYSEEGDDGPITLTSGGSVEDAETALERAAEWISVFLADQGAPARRAAILVAGEAEHHRPATLERALDHLLRVKAIQKPQRGWYERRGPLEGKPGEP